MDNSSRSDRKINKHKNYFKHNRLFDECPGSEFKPPPTKCPKLDNESP